MTEKLRRRVVIKATIVDGGRVETNKASGDVETTVDDDGLIHF